LAFHPYPHLIRVVFNPQRFGPPPGVTPASPWTWIDRFGFGSASTHSSALFRLAFAPAPDLKSLTSRVNSNSPDHNAKGTPSRTIEPESPTSAPTACMHTVSGSISLAVRRSFHLSLTVLFPIGHRLVFSLGGWSPQIQPGFLVSRPTRVPDPSVTRISPTGLSPSPVRRSRRSRLSFLFGSVRSLNPAASLNATVWALPLSLAATQGISSLISLPPGTEMFQFPGFAPRVSAVTGSPPPGCPIRISPDHRSLAAPRGFSQLATSFFAGLCLGIHRAHFLA
jgi:hypothetical protein